MCECECIRVRVFLPPHVRTALDDACLPRPQRHAVDGPERCQRQPPCVWVSNVMGGVTSLGCCPQLLVQGLRTSAVIADQGGRRRRRRRRRPYSTATAAAAAPSKSAEQGPVLLADGTGEDAVGSANGCFDD